MSPLHSCLETSNVVDEWGNKLDNQRKEKKDKVYKALKTIWSGSRSQADRVLASKYSSTIFMVSKFY